MTSTLVTLTDPTSPVAEAYRRLRTNLSAPSASSATPSQVAARPGFDGRLQAILVAAAGPDTDKATVVANLAVTFARVGKRVILVDCDLRHPEQHVLFGLENGEGLTSALDRETGDVGEAVALPLQGTEVSGLSVLTSGPSVSVPSEVLASEAMGQLIERLRAEADVILFDAPPVVLASDAVELATRVDGVLLVVAAGRTKRQRAQEAVSLLGRVGARLVGATLVNLPADAGVREYLST